MIKNIVFDIGEVCVDFCYKDFFRSFGYSEDIVRRIERATVESPAWDLGDVGILSEQELLELYIRQDPKIEAQLCRVCENFAGIIRERKETIPWLKALRAKGYRVYYLSNFPAKIERECSQNLAFLAYMDGGILSYKEHVVKPDKAIYELLLSRYGLKAQECLFIDDRMVNCEAALSVGYRSIQYTDRDEVIRKMAELGI